MCPAYVVRVRAFENTRTAADDETEVKSPPPFSTLVPSSPSLSVPVDLPSQVPQTAVTVGLLDGACSLFTQRAFLVFTCFVDRELQYKRVLGAAPATQQFLQKMRSAASARRKCDWCRTSYSNGLSQ